MSRYRVYLRRCRPLSRTTSPPSSARPSSRTDAGGGGGSHSARSGGLGQVLSAPAADLVEGHALAARDALARGDRPAAAASETSIACGVPADLAVFAHVIEGERHHDDFEKWIEAAVQGAWRTGRMCSNRGDWEI
jgi:hypothetical protein